MKHLRPEGAALSERTAILEELHKAFFPEGEASAETPIAELLASFGCAKQDDLAFYFAGAATALSASQDPAATVARLAPAWRDLRASPEVRRAAISLADPLAEAARTGGTHLSTQTDASGDVAKRTQQASAALRARVTTHGPPVPEPPEDPEGPLPSDTSTQGED